MLTIYVKTGCPYCAMVEGKVSELGLEVEYKNIADDQVASELVEIGGKRQVPFLCDSDRDVKMYESSDVVDYLTLHYGKKETPQ